MTSITSWSPVNRTLKCPLCGSHFTTSSRATRFCKPCAAARTKERATAAYKKKAEIKKINDAFSKAGVML